MKKYKIEEVTEEVQILSQWKCDKCGEDLLDASENLTEEPYSFDFYGGYSSAFGDMNHVTCDLCSRCLYKMIGDICHYNEGAIE